jgi:hypothetical protein
MKMKWLCLLFFFSGSTCLQAQVTVKKICECTMDANISSTVKFSSSSFYPGKTYKAYVTVSNAGSCIWAPKEIELRVKILRCPSGSACQRDEFIPKKWDMNEAFVDPKESTTFIYDWEGPAYTGKFTLQYQMYYDNKAIGDPIPAYIEILPAKN